MSAKPKRGLGRGFEALLSSDFDKSLVINNDERIQKLAIDIIVPNSDQPRRKFDEAALNELAESIKQHGVLLPLVVVSIDGGLYQIVAGERRWRASRIAGLDTVPAVVRSLKELERLEVALIENVQRVDLSPLEQAVSLQKLHEQFSTAYDEIAKRLGKAPSTITNTIRLLQLPAPAKEALTDRQISEGHARAILALRTAPENQAKLLSAILQNGWSVRQAERYVISLKQDGKDAPKTVLERVQTETPETKALGKRLGTIVQVKRMAKGGKLEINFKSDKDLKEIINKLG